MKRIIRAAERHVGDFGWLKTYWLFSFGDYHDPNNINFGPLRVFNDDIVEAGRGFDSHPHREMEIVTYVLEGAVSHEDSLGNKTTIPAGEIQRMSAGTGIIHSEYNRGNEALKLYQVWFIPREKRLKPSYAQSKVNLERAKNKPLTLVSGFGDGVLSMESDASLSLLTLEAGKDLTLKAGPTKMAFFYVASGEFEVDGDTIRAGDQFRQDGPESTVLKSTAPESTCVYIAC